MANLTITVDEQVLKQARIRALKQETSVEALLRDFLERFTRQSQAEQAVEEIHAVGRRVRSGSGTEARTWRRNDLHDR